MSSKFYTNAVLTFIALFLAAGLLKSSIPFETEVSAHAAGYKEYQLVYTYPKDNEGAGNKKLAELTKDGWKPVAITQSVLEGYGDAHLTLLMAR